MACYKKLVAEIPEGNFNVDDEHKKCAAGLELKTCILQILDNANKHTSASLSVINKCFSEGGSASQKYLREQSLHMLTDISKLDRYMEIPCPRDIVEEMDEDPKKINEEADALFYTRVHGPNTESSDL